MPKSSIASPRNPPLFISHAAADKTLVNIFTETILISGIGIPRETIFNTSAISSPIPAGSNFSEEIRKALLSARFVVALVTPNYQERPFAMAELGAAWANGTVVPIVIPPLDFGTTAGVLKGTQCLAINSKDNLSSLYDRLTGTQKNKKPWFTPAGHRHFEGQRDHFLNELLPKQLKAKVKAKKPAPSPVTKPSPAKSLEDEKQEFDRLLADVRKALAKVPLVVRIAFMAKTIERVYLTSPENKAEVSDAQLRGYIKISPPSPEISRNTDEQEITPTQTTQQNRDIQSNINKLGEFLTTASPSFHLHHEENSGYAANSQLPKFWAKNDLLSEPDKAKVRKMLPK
ncbi:toll/interleukin-1 receptor domain-containing protein [Myxococcus sp. AM010]|uniref:toll/interleukin-1 receptor domain-containing protein n=1 Tax=Myxococcus sp. AM010 TaxID=2745138 RepID=UPI001595CA1C|nr:toll/interleukin-1 receptor domain-containing protein [Myxococcus sp. AM010]NVJ14214.1 toll/interleukin-1 receptor domain-containing protein [Myxococcus sp. AM010]